LVLQEPHGMTSQKTAFYMYFGGEKDWFSGFDGFMGLSPH
jgi:hypothetical protein